MLKKSRNLLVAIIILPALIALITPGDAGAANHAPVAKNKSVTTKEDTAKAIRLVAADADGDKLTYKIVAQPAHGTLSGTPPKVTYTPKANYNGSDSFSFKANDGKVDSNKATVSITVIHVNHPPVAKNKSVTTKEDTAKAITLVATDVDGDSLTYTVVSGPSHGTLTGSGANRTYTPAANYYGSDSLTFKANDSKVDSNTAKVSITVTAVNDAPVAQNQSVTTNQDTAKAITLVATDVDGDSLTYTVVSGPSHGTLTGSGANRTYTPTVHYYGSDSFTFKAKDSKVDSNTAKVSITVTAVNDAPVAQDQSVTTLENTPKAVQLVATDADGDPLTYTVMTQPGHGILTGPQAGLTYTPNASYTGSDSFTFKANDGKVDSNVATVSITVTSVRGIITTVAGNGVYGYSGDGGLATQAMLTYPHGVVVDASGNLYIADRDNERVRKVDTNGIITTVAGNGVYGYSGDGGPATQAMLRWPYGGAVDASGNLYIADMDNNRIRKVNANGIITRVAGNGIEGFSGDGGPAAQARLYWPAAVAVDGFGQLYIADSGNNRIRKVDTKGIITTVAGNEMSGYNGDGGPATEATLDYPHGVAVDASGNLYIGDMNNYRIRKVDTNGIITTIAGGMGGGYAGDGGPATQAQLYFPQGVALDTSGNLYIADNENNCIRKVDANGIITTVAGNGTWGYSGDGGPATQAKLYYPTAVAVDGLGNLYIADSENHRIRLVKGVFIPTKAIVAGRVTDSSTSQPLSDVEVTIKNSLNTFVTKTRSNGIYTLSGLTPESFTATFEKSGYLKQTVTGTLIAGQTQTIDIQLLPVPLLNLTITSPQDEAIFNSSPIAVGGTVTNNANVTVNGIQASVSNNTFSASIPLSEGSNIVTALASDQYGQTVSQTANVSLITRGGITGTVTDASTNLPLVSATVSITDSSNITKTVLTDNTGGYTITDISSGTLNGSITKDGYTAYNFSNTITPGQTIPVNASLNPMLPIISNIQVSGVTKNSATLTWTTDQPADTFVDYGTTSSYGNWVRDSVLTTSHTIALTNLALGTTYHFKVTSTNGYGFSSSSGDRTFETQKPLLTLVITSPSNGATINRSDVMVRGTVINAMGNETGVTVNGKLAMVFGSEFVANHIPLEEGANTIEVVATDTEGNTVTTTVVASGVIANQYINLTANTESGISPLEVVLTIDSSLNLANASLTYTGPGEAEFLSTSLSEYTVKLTAEGIYYFTVSIISGGTLYQDSMGIVVLSEAELDALLRGKWESMRNRLAIGDIEGALVFFHEDARQDYRDLFNVLSSMLSTIVQDMSDIQMIEYHGNAAIYDIQTSRDGIEYSFQLLFTKDSAGVWRINPF
jgi:ribosomal protein S30